MKNICISCLAVCVLLAATTAGHAATYEVNQTTGPNFTIGDALTAAEGAADTAAVINVTDLPVVTYTEALTVNTTNTVINFNGNTVSDATNSLLVVNAPNVQINDLVIAGGGRVETSAGAYLQATGCTFADGANHGVVLNGTSFTAINCQFLNNTRSGINANAGEVRISDSVFTGNGANGGGDDHAGIRFNAAGTLLDCQDSTFTANATGVMAGGFVSTTTVVGIDIDGCVMDNRVAGIGVYNNRLGGGDYTNKTFNVRNTTITDSTGPFINIDRDYALITVNGSDNVTINIENCDMQGFPGGAISLLGSNAVLTISTSTLGASTIDGVVSVRGNNNNVTLNNTDILNAAGNGALISNSIGATIELNDCDILDSNSVGLNVNVGENQTVTMRGGSIVRATPGGLNPVMISGNVTANPAFVCRNNVARLEGVEIRNHQGFRIGESGATGTGEQRDGNDGNLLYLKDCVIDNCVGPHATWNLFSPGNTVTLDNTTATQCGPQGFITIQADTAQGGNFDDLSGAPRTVINVSTNSLVQTATAGSGVWHLSDPSASTATAWARWPDVEVNVTNGARFRGFTAWTIAKDDTGPLNIIGGDTTGNARGFILNAGFSTDTVTIADSQIGNTFTDIILQLQSPGTVLMDNVDASGSFANGFLMNAGGTLIGRNVDLSNGGGGASAIWINGPGCTVDLDDTTITNYGTAVVNAAAGSSITVSNALIDDVGQFLNGGPATGDVLFEDVIFGEATGRAFAVSNGGYNTTLERPVFTGRAGDITFWGANFSGTFTVRGMPENKADLSPLVANGTVLISRFCGGTISFIDVENRNRGNGLMDSHFEGDFGSTLTVNLTRCLFENGGGDLSVGGAGVTDPVTFGLRPIDPSFGTIINQINTIHNGTPSGWVIDTWTASTTRTTPVIVNLLHCTFVGPHPSTWFSNSTPDGGAIAEDLFNLFYNIWDNSEGGIITGPPDGTAVSLSCRPAVGDGNIIWDPQPLVGAGGFTRGEGGLTNTIRANPLLTEEGRLVSTSSPAFNAAVGSPAVDDVDGQPRPTNGVSDIGADEFARRNNVELWGLFN